MLKLTNRKAARVESLAIPPLRYAWLCKGLRGDGVNKKAGDVGPSKLSVERVTKVPGKALKRLSRWC